MTSRLAARRWRAVQVNAHHLPAQAAVTCHGSMRVTGSYAFDKSRRRCAAVLDTLGEPSSAFRIQGKPSRLPFPMLPR